MPLGDRALLVNFEQKIDPDIHSQVMDLSAKVEEASVDGVTFTLPAYCSVTIGFDPKKVSYLDLKPTIISLLKQPATKSTVSSRSLTLPVCYEEPYALDLQEVSSPVAAELHQIRVKNVGERIELYGERIDAARAEDLVVLDLNRRVPVVETDEDVGKADRRPVS